MKLSTLRRLSQTASFLLFVGIFLFTQYPNATKFPLDAFLRLDPLVAAVAMIGGEESGGYAFRGNVPERDGILAGLYLVLRKSRAK